MSKTRGLFKRMSPYNADKARNLVDAMLMSTKDIGWDSNHQLIVNGRVYHNTDIVRLIGHVMSPADDEFKKPIGLKVFVEALRKIGLEPDYVKNKDVKRMLRKNSYMQEDDEELSIDSSDIEEEDYSEDEEDDESMDESNESDAESHDENEDSLNECKDSGDAYNNQSDTCDDDDDDDGDYDDGSTDSVNDGNDNEDSNDADSDDIDDVIRHNAVRGKTRYNWKSISDSDDEYETN